MNRRIAQNVFCFFILVALSFPSYSQAQSYDFEKPTKRLALVVANADYESEAKLPGTVQDANTISQILTASGFDVTDARNVSRAELVDFYLRPFLGKIKQDDFVVFYFSGHGFSYGGENYLVPLRFTMSEDDIASRFVSTTAIQDLLSEKKPGFLLLLLDACRNIADSMNVSPPDATARKIEKTIASMRESHSGNIIVGYSSDQGKPSIGSSKEGELSIYTKSLSKFLPKPDTDFSKVRDEVHFDVLYETKDQQKPWFSDGSSAEIYFMPSQTLYEQERTAWISALDTRDFKQISRFLKLYNVSRFAAAARKWLADNKNAPTSSLSRISPLAPEFAWVEAMDSISKPLKIRRIEGPLAFSRVAKATMSESKVIFRADILALRTDLGAPAKPLAPAARPAEVFAKHGEAVTTGPIAGYLRPDETSKIVVALASNTKLSVEGFDVDALNQTWAQVRVPGEDKTAYISISPTTVSRTTDIGKPLLEIKIGRLPGGLKSLADVKIATEAFKKLQREGRSIAWVSIATPGPSQEAGELSSARAAHLTYALDREGISRQRISVVEQASDLQGDDLRVRFFGN